MMHTAACEHRFSPIRSLALTAISGLLVFSTAPAADPALRSVPAVSDVVLARSALAALDADPFLRDANLLVSVVDRVAVLGGPVASIDHGKRAEMVIRRVPGLVEVKNRCFVQDAPDPLLRAMSVGSASRPLLEASLPSIVASPRTGQVEEFTPTLGGNSLAQVEPAGKSVVALRPTNPSDSVLLPPVGAVSPPKTAPSTPPAPALLAGRTAEAMAAVESLRKSDARFAALHTSFANGTVVIAGTAAKASDAWDLAQQLRRIPGVPRVAIGAVSVK